MKYQIRPGVVLAKACGEYLLLATLEACQHCPYVYQINETAAFLWKLLEQQLTEEEIVAEVAAVYEAPEEAVCRDFRQFVNDLQEKGYLLLEEVRA